MSVSVLLSVFVSIMIYVSIIMVFSISVSQYYYGCQSVFCQSVSIIVSQYLVCQYCQYQYYVSVSQSVFIIMSVLWFMVVSQ